MKIAAARFNPFVGDITGNVNGIVKMISEARYAGADLVVFPELAVTGYPPMDLVHNRRYVDENLGGLERIAESASGIDVICGFVDRDPENHDLLYNAAAFISSGTVQNKYHKMLLPVYDVFDEPRYFNPGKDLSVIDWKGLKLGVSVCEDIWNAVPVNDDLPFETGRYQLNPVRGLCDKKVDLIVNISASPFARGKDRIKQQMLADICRRYDVSLMYVNQLGGNDSLVFDGACYLFNRKGEITGYGKPFEEGPVVMEYNAVSVPVLRDEISDLYNALVLGLRDYMRKCGFTKTVLGLSGGIDSALTAVVAVSAVGASNVTGITMPSMYSSPGSVSDSLQLAANLAIRVDTVSITELYHSYMRSLKPLFRDIDTSLAEENIQARIRGNILMALSNMEGSLLLTTGNKSELATGYCTLYGDMSGGLAVISDVPKTMVYELARYVNRDKEIIPQAIIDKPPSAELRPDQKDQDTLPPYDILDAVLELYIERRMEPDEIVLRGFDREIVKRIIHLVDLSEYKRRQAAPGLKVTSKAFGSGRRIPIARKLN